MEGWKAMWQRAAVFVLVALFSIVAVAGCGKPVGGDAQGPGRKNLYTFRYLPHSQSRITNGSASGRITEPPSTSPIKRVWSPAG